jgi:hypothetical protein
MDGDWEVVLLLSRRGGSGPGLVKEGPRIGRWK